jgi:hypothetical protein
VKNWSPALRDHYASDVTTLTTCWKATLQNGTIVAATKLDRDLVIDGVTYQSVAGFFDSDVENTAELNPDNLEVSGFLVSPAITDADIHSGAWDYAAIEMFEVNYNDPSMGKNILRTGTLGEVKGGRIKFTAELRGLMQAYTRTVVRLMTKDCNADLGDSRCKVDMAPFTATGTVGGTNSTNSVIYDSGRTEAGPDGAKTITDISQAENAVVTCPTHGFAQNTTVQLSDIVGCTLSGATKDGVFYAGSGDGLNGMLFQITVIDPDHFRIPVDTRAYNADQTVGVSDPLQVYSPYVSGGLAHPANASGYFDHGLVTFNSGENAGLSMEVKAYAPGVITLMLPMPFEISVGDTYTVTAGCNQAFETCQQRFNNVVNYRGFPNLPQSKIYRRGADGISSSGSAAGAGGGGSGGGTGALTGSITGFIMPNPVETTFLGSIPTSVIFPETGMSKGYFAVDLLMPIGAKILGYNYNGAQGVLVDGSLSSQTEVSGTIRPITKDEIVTYLNSDNNVQYELPTTTLPATGVTTNDNPVAVTVGGFQLSYTTRDEIGYLTTTGRKRVWNPSATVRPVGDTQWSPSLHKLVSIVGDSKTMHSVDGKTWEEHPIYENRYYTVFIWSEQAGKFIYYTMPTFAGGSYFMGEYVPYNTMVSDDGGVTWREQIGAPDVLWRSVLPVPSLGITVGIGNAAGLVSGISYDGGLTWTLTPLTVIPDRVRTNTLNIAWSPELERFAAVYSNIDGYGAVTSADGINWDLCSTPVGMWHNVTWISELGLFIACGESHPLRTPVNIIGSVLENTQAYSIMTSPDGINWTAVTNVFYPAYMFTATWCPELNAVVVNGIIHFSLATFRIYSSDGINWTSMVPNDGDGIYVEELGLLTSPAGWGDSTFEPETTYYWPYDRFTMTYSAT